MTKREIVKRAIVELKRMQRVKEKFLNEKDFDGVKYMEHDILASVNLLWYMEIINLDKKKYLLKCFGLR